ncbi:GNAT family N-acetyltransferase [Hwangdonia lutea]|uniref:GNAT family N-acetyltransferase n=1 Tax=Hwangdonia lutea TaxID=3075823 RepID=A0AA97HR30_9FLAO|nr:GNAT family N-acetyltransferase [Hwangdonia sp. SCSIO 19198]WOD43378.1 GNAT family N-acetyltransferase [Hwangdonia sp. SCSIO 19198]
MTQLRKEQFIYDFLQNGKAIVPGCYKYIYVNNKSFLNKKAFKPNQLSDVIYVSLFPTFLDFKIVNEPAYHSKKIIHHGISGAGILLDENYTVESYLDKHTNNKFRKNLRKYFTGLKDSCNVRYVCYYGRISKERCDFLLDALREMIEKRFKTKNVKHVFMAEWDNNVKDLHELINHKKSSLIVVYDEDKPISISLNRHINNSIFFGELHAYNANYSKYGLGHINNHLRLNWCIDNKFDFIDLGIGVFDNKKIWCNVFYNVEYHLFYKKKSLKTKAIALLEIYKINFKNFIKSKTIGCSIKKIKSFFNQ